MSKKSLLALPLLLAVPVLAASGWPARPLADLVLKSADHEKLGELIGEWMLARIGQHRKLTSIEARENIRIELDKWSKKRGVDGRDALSLTEDLGAAVWYSFSYDKQKNIKKGKVNSVDTTTADGRDISYAFWAPGKYRAQLGPMPLVLCIAGEGEAPTAHLTERWVDAGIREGALLACIPMPANTADWKGMPGLGNFFAVMKDVTTRYAVDFDRIYVAGRGLGVATAMEIVSRFPDRFAGVIGRTGDAAELPPDNFRNVPCFFAGAGKAASDFQAACREAGHDNVTLDAEGQEPQVWAWIQDHPRSSNPVKLTLRPGDPFPERAYWLQVPRTDTDALVQAEIDRSLNKITIEAKGVTQVILSFNDLLVDLDRPVKVVCNGLEHEDRIPRNLDTFLERVYLTSNDPGKLYVATRVYDVPAAGGARQ